MEINEGVWSGAVGEEVMMRQRRGVEREGRRRRRREKRERGETRETSEHKQGLSTDDELLEMNRLKFENNMSEPLISNIAKFTPSHILTLCVHR